MNDLRTAAQQALEALVSENSLSAVAMQQRMDAIRALRAALAQQAEPVEPVAVNAAYQRWLEDTHAPALRRMDSRGAFSAGWQAAALAQQAEPALEALIENARLLGATQAKKGFGCYSQEDARLERAWREGIAKHSAALRTALAQQAEPVDTDCHTQGICQRSGYGIPKP